MPLYSAHKGGIIQVEIPLIGFGTWLLSGRECENAVRLALEAGYRHIDTAFHYENHNEIAKAIKGYDREKLFITSKLAIGLGQIDDQSVQKSVERALDTALKELQTDYLDLFLIHYPDRDRPIEEILEAMHALVSKGKLRSPGVSNYTQHHLQDAYDRGVKVPFNQVEFHPYLYQKELLEFSLKNGTRLIAYRPFGKGQLLEDEPLFASIGKGHNKTAGQVVLRWIIQKNIPVIPKASSEDHIRENLALFDFELSNKEMAQIDGLNKNFRYCAREWNEFNY